MKIVNIFIRAKGSAWIYQKEKPAEIASFLKDVKCFWDNAYKKKTQSATLNQ